MTQGQELQLMQVADAYFHGPFVPEEIRAREDAYQAFRARLILDLKVVGYAVDGNVVVGSLEPRR